MRDYRFRVWNPATETMTYNVGLDSISEYADEPLVKMQQTGLKDRNGNNVYEGDIVQFLDAYVHGEDGDWDECACTGQIKWDSEMAQFYVTNRESMDNDDFWEQIDEAEVQGNIYMTPELLKQE